MKKAAEQGDASAEYILATSYDFGLGKNSDLEFIKDLGLARHWYELSAAQGVSESKNALARLDSENTPITLVGFISKARTKGTDSIQTLQLASPVSLGGRSWNVISLCPVQNIDRYMPYTSMIGNLHWVGDTPQLKIDQVEMIRDKGTHLVNYLTKSKEYVPDSVSVKFKDDTSEEKMVKILAAIGVAKPFVQNLIKNNYSVKINKGMTVVDALKKLVDLYEVEYAQPWYIGHLD